MNGPEFVFTLLLGMALGTFITLMIQRYGRRKVEKALAGSPTLQADQSAARNVALLAGENEKQQHLIVRLEERIHVLERIATDSPKRLADTIDALR